ncbi:hypothetical protein [Fodinibius salsisoli]|uniref:Uncharacterized protein n=1 Tax=Fodinibius salsisoli TaxID=2820877 RepID=A0ABT3PIC5_9BACT|nr:hypothetical protein [Fodinibius salsisoli]MCW9705659.1 hypothetical protein [Fodinibius salsisoli]
MTRYRSFGKPSPIKDAQNTAYLYRLMQAEESKKDELRFLGLNSDSSTRDISRKNREGWYPQIK